MSHDADNGGRHQYPAPPANKGLMALAGLLVLLPIIALMLVGTYARKDPVLFGFPFFIWYQFVWVFVCSGLVYAAYRIVLVARPHRRMNEDGSAFTDEEDAR